MAVGEGDSTPEETAVGGNEPVAETPAPMVEGSYEWLAKLVLKDDSDVSAALEPCDSVATGAPVTNEESSAVEHSETTGESSVSGNSQSDSGNIESKAEEAAQKAAAHTLLHDLLVRQVFKYKLRIQNQRAASIRPDERDIAKLDSSLKRNSAFVRKLRNFTCAQLEGLLRDMASLNLSKYLTEVAAAIVEAKLKVTDVGAAVVLCSLLHQTYSEFSPALFDNWQKILNLKRDEKIVNPSKLRVDLRFYGDLVSVSVFQQREALSLLGHILSNLVMADKEEHHNASIILSFCRHCGDDYAGLVPTVVREAAALLGVKIPRSSLLLAEKQKAVRTLLTDYYASLCKHLLKEHDELRAVEQQNRRILQTKGELSAERRERLETVQQQYCKLQASLQSFADVLDQPLPDFPEEPAVKSEEECVFGVLLGGGFGFGGPAGDGDEGAGASGGSLLCGLWEDEETQRFYEDLPNIQEYLPGRSKDNKDTVPPETAEPVSQVTEEELDAEIREEDLMDEGEPALPEEEMDEPEVEPEAGPEAGPEAEPVGSSGSTTKQQLEAFLAHLPQCVNCELIDNAAAEFVVSLNAKSNKKKLVRVLFGVPRTRIDLLPFYARLVATLHPVLPEVAQDLCSMLKQDFKYHIRKKDQINIESKLKVVRFIGELVKFGMYPLMEGLYCLKVLLHDFTHHHVDMACALLETCGRYFLRRPQSHQRTKIYLEQMMRKKTALAMDSRYVTMIENAFFFVNPPEGSTVKIKERPPIHVFIRKTLYQDLSKPTTDKVLRLMRRLNWEDKDLAAYAIKCLTAAWNVKYYNIRCLASLVAGLVEHQEAVGSMVVDGVLEDIRVGMELNLPKLNQRRVAMMKYLGELYNYRVVESGDVFKVLYSLVRFGVSFDLANPSPLDPPDHLFRIRLVCTLLATCGLFFVNGPSRQRLDYFIIYFEHYYWFKRESALWASTDQLNALTGGLDAEPVFPISMEYLFRDTILALRPNLTLCTSLEEASAAITKLQTTLISQLPTLSPQPARNDNSELSTIAEDSEKETDTEKDATDLSSYEEDNEADEADSGEEDYDDERDRDRDRDREGGIDDEDEDSGSHPDPNYSKADADLLDSADVVRIRRQEQEEVCEEDKVFVDELDRMVTGNLQDRARASSKPQQVDIAIPLHVRASHKKTYEQLQESNDGDTVNFVLLTRRGNKQAYRSLAVPVSSELALNLRNQEQAERVEMEQMKKLTLDINERLEEEDYQDMLACQQRPTTVNLNRERRNRYQHPKGAPDADLIFGPKKVR